MNILSWEGPAEDGSIRSKCGDYYVSNSSWYVKDVNNQIRIGLFGGKAGKEYCETHARKLLAKHTMRLACLVLGIQVIADICGRHRSQISRWKNGHALVPVEVCADIEAAVIAHDSGSISKNVMADNLRPDVEFIRQNGVIVDHKFKKEI